MAKPTKSTEWATDGAALKADPDSRQISYGWSFSGNTLSGTPTKPNLQQQNGWQNAVYRWIDWMDGQLPDGELAIVDLWRWDLCDTSSGKTGNYLDGFKESSGISGALEMHYTDGAYGYDWVSDKGDAMMASRYWEVLDMFSRGIGFQIVDASDVIWTVYPTGNWTNFDTPTNNNLNWVNLEANLSGGPGGPSYVQFDPSAWVGNEFFTIRKDDGGVITNPTDFTGFTAITNANFATYNPNGVRAVLVGNKNLDFSYTSTAGNRIALKDLKKRWVRTWQCSDHSIVPEDNSTTGIFNTQIPLEKGVTYKFKMFGCPTNTTGQLANATYTQEVETNDIWANVAGSQVIHQYQRKYYNSVGGTCDYKVACDLIVAGDGTEDYLTVDGLNLSQGLQTTGTIRLVQNDIAKIILEET